MTRTGYSMSFTTGGLFRRESLLLAELYLTLKDWAAVRDAVVAENLLQARTRRTLTRVCSEVVSRLKLLRPQELEFLVSAGFRDQGYVLWLAVCRRYPFIGEFAAEVVRERFLTLKADVPAGEFDAFFNRKAEQYETLDEITPTTREKLRQVLFKMLREVDLLTAGNEIRAAGLSPALVTLIRRGNPGDALFFPDLNAM
ncbi:MAG: DUF1819 family protein [Methylobacteriaceae bacterium]|jgi:hypothetical protein|nr:DUF1819 family protein [Methylobacteriaceae bacterium]